MTVRGGLPHLLKERGKNVPVLECRLVHPLAQKEPQDIRVFASPFEPLHQLLVVGKPLQERDQCLSLDLLVSDYDRKVFRSEFKEHIQHLCFILDILFRLALLDLEERGLGNIEIAFFDDLRHLPVEKCQQERPYVSAVHIRVRHEYDLMIADLRYVEVLRADAGSERGDEDPDLFGAEHLVEARLLDVQYLSPKRQNRLCAPSLPCLAEPPAESPSTIKSSLSAGSFSEQSASLPGRPVSSSAPFPPGEFPRLPCRLPGACSLNRLFDDLSGDRGVLFKVSGERLVYDRFDDALHLAVAELHLCLALELRVRQLHTDDGGEALPDVIA